MGLPILNMDGYLLKKINQEISDRQNAVTNLSNEVNDLLSKGIYTQFPPYRTELGVPAYQRYITQGRLIYEAQEFVEVSENLHTRSYFSTNLDEGLVLNTYLPNLETECVGFLLFQPYGATINGAGFKRDFTINVKGINDGLNDYQTNLAPTHFSISGSGNPTGFTVMTEAFRMPAGVQKIYVDVIDSIETFGAISGTFSASKSLETYIYYKQIEE